MADHPTDFSDATWQALSPKIGLRYRMAKSLNTYVSYSRGFRPAMLDDMCKNGNVTNNSWVPGGPGAAVDVRTFYTYHFVLPFVANVLNPGGNGVVLQSTVIFKNEPYP